MKQTTTIRTLLAAGLIAFVAAVTALAVYATGGFTDTSDHPQAADIQYAVDQGWFQGYDDGTFRPEQKIKKHQVAAVFQRALPEEGMTRADVASFLRRGFNEDYKRGEWDVSRGKWDRAKADAPWAFYANMSRSECPNKTPQLDHLVSVKRANDAGGWRWSVEVKEQFYLLPENLHLMCPSDNIRKDTHFISSKWQPNPASKARYVAAVEKIARDWQLDLDVLTADTTPAAPVASTTTTIPTVTTIASTTTTMAVNDQVCINTAPAAELMRLDGVKETISRNIIAERNVRPFESLDDLDRVPLIGPAKIRDIKAQGLAAVC